MTTVDMTGQPDEVFRARIDWIEAAQPAPESWALEAVPDGWQDYKREPGELIAWLRGDPS
jgi:hypothetical protein